MQYSTQGVDYELNLIDTPGHVDFSYEVSRAMAACEGCLLVVDAAQGIEAQTISNLYLAIEHDLLVVPLINKIDLPGADIDSVCAELVHLLGCKSDDILRVSAKDGIGISAVLEAIVARIPAPVGQKEAPLQAIIFDSRYNSYRGVEVLFRIFNGRLPTGAHIRFMHSGRAHEVQEVGVLKLKQCPVEVVETGSVGYLVAGIKKTREVQVGETITLRDTPAHEPLKGFEDVKPMVFSGLYPTDNGDFEDLRAALEKLQLNDASLVWEPEHSQALGFGFRCGFLGLLHMEVVQERLEREFGVSIVLTVPSVRFRAYKRDKTYVDVHTPMQLPEGQYIDHLEEPYIRAQIITKSDYIGRIISLCMDKRGTLMHQHYLTPERVELVFALPLSEIVFDFYDKLKSISQGYASFDYELLEYRTSKLVRLDILLNGSRVDALCSIVHKDKAYGWGKRLCEKLHSLIPRQMFEVAIQAALGSKVIARETVKAIRKNVTAKCYGGDITRKRKLLEKQKAGKKRMRQVGNIEVPQEAFMAVLKM